MRLTKFIRAYSPEELTQVVQEAEHGGWTYAGLEIASEICLVAVMQREAPQAAGQTQLAGAPFLAGGMRGSQ